jgi:hypothetical protein
MKKFSLSPNILYTVPNNTFLSGSLHYLYYPDAVAPVKTAIFDFFQKKTLPLPQFFLLTQDFFL